ncbi:hypothetical protein VIBNIAM115_1830019 [Vibrio nigripulchritudo AM115]|nr:hypothetical protein VIBNIAM115_1830019 [Vibrio nigripulchritudo AM115]
MAFLQRLMEHFISGLTNVSNHIRKLVELFKMYNVKRRNAYMQLFCI